MSGGMSWSPECTGRDYTGVVWHPTGDNIYYPGETMLINFTTLSNGDLDRGASYYFNVWITCLHQAIQDYATVNVLSKSETCHRELCWKHDANCTDESE